MEGGEWSGAPLPEGALLVGSTGLRGGGELELRAPGGWLRPLTGQTRGHRGAGDEPSATA